MPRAERVAAVRLGDVGVDEVGPHRVPPEPAVQRADGCDRARVEHRRGRRVPVAAHELGRVRQERDQGQGEQVDLEERRVGVLDQAEHAMVGQPVSADHEHAQAIAQERAALVLDEVPELTIDLVGRAVEVRELEVQDKEREHDREDAVTERVVPIDPSRPEPIELGLPRRAVASCFGDRLAHPVRLRRDESESADLVALVDELVGREPRSSPARSRRARCPRRPSSVVAVAAHREAELQTLGRAVLAAAHDGERVPVAARESGCQTLFTESIAACAADAADDEPRASMTAAPRFWTVSMNSACEPVLVGDHVGHRLAADLARARSRGTGSPSGCPRSRGS